MRWRRAVEARARCRRAAGPSRVHARRRRPPASSRSTVRLLEHAGADAAEHVVGAALLDDDGVDAGLVQQRAEQQARGPGADDRDLGSHRRLALQHRAQAGLRVQQGRQAVVDQLVERNPCRMDADVHGREHVAAIALQRNRDRAQPELELLVDERVALRAGARDLGAQPVRVGDGVGRQRRQRLAGRSRRRPRAAASRPAARGRWRCSTLARGCPAAGSTKRRGRRWWRRCRSRRRRRARRPTRLPSASRRACAARAARCAAGAPSACSSGPGAAPWGVSEYILRSLVTKPRYSSVIR